MEALPMFKLVVVTAVLVALGCVACSSGGICQCQECKDYVTCADRIGGAQASGVDATYGSMGTCWSTGVQATADACVNHCAQALPMLKAQYPDAGC
jgi:hypothetical protein